MELQQGQVSNGSTTMVCTPVALTTLSRLVWSGTLEAIRSGGTPRDTEYYTARRVRDFAQIKGNGTIDIEIAKYIKALNVDALVLMKWITRF
jgi:hypothetical protein